MTSFMTNALWTKNICRYRHGYLRAQSANKIIDLKISRRRILLKKYNYLIHTDTLPRSPLTSTEKIFLYEARAAKKFWQAYKTLLPNWCAFPGRHPQQKDITNSLLDIGYHYLYQLIKQILAEKNISPALGMLHEAQSAHGAPLVYDLSEMFRADTIDTEVLRYLRLKKNTLTTLKTADIAHFLHQVKQRINRKYYLQDFKQCHTYRYYMELQILKFIKAVNHQEPYKPLHLPTRHETRC